MLTLEDNLAIMLTYVVEHLGGSIKISKDKIDNRGLVRLVWDDTSDPESITLATISNEVVMVTLDRDGILDVM